MILRKRFYLVLVIVIALASGTVIFAWKTKFRSLKLAQPAQTQLELPQAAQNQTAQAETFDHNVLPDYLEKPGLASRKFGSLRVYVAVEREIEAKKNNQYLGSVPIMVILENDSYKRLDPSNDLGLTGNVLFNVRVTSERQGKKLVALNQPQYRTELSGWEPAERKKFIVNWPISPKTSGDFTITVELAFGSRYKVETHTRIK